MKVMRPVLFLNFHGFSMTSKPNPSSGIPSRGDSTSSQNGRPIATATGSIAPKAADKILEKASESAHDARGMAIDIKNDVKAKADDMTSDVKDQATQIADEVKGQASKAVQDFQQEGTRLVDKAQQSGEKVIKATREYAKSAVGAAGKKMRQVQGQYEAAKSTTTELILEDPVRAVTVAAIGSAVLTAALIGIFRRR